MDFLTYDVYYYRILEELENLKKKKLQITEEKKSKLVNSLPFLYSLNSEMYSLQSNIEKKQ